MERRAHIATRVIIALSLLGIPACSKSTSISYGSTELDDHRMTIPTPIAPEPETLPLNNVDTGVVIQSILDENDQPVFRPPEERIIPIAENCISPVVGNGQVALTQRFNQLVLDRDGNPIEVDGRFIRHLGIDIAPLAEDADKEFSVVSICDGEFVLSTEIGQNEGSSLGKIVVIKYFDGTKYFYTVYAHLASILTSNHQPGDFIRKGEVLGIMGNSGGWVNKHLHIHMWGSNSWEIFVDTSNPGFYPNWDQEMINATLIDPATILPPFKISR